MLLILPVMYSGLWYFTAWKTKNALRNFLLSVTDKSFDISSDLSSFPFNFVFHIKNSRFSFYPVTISFKSLTLKNRLFGNSLYIYVPNDEFDIIVSDEKGKNVKCTLNNNNYLLITMNSLLSSLQFDENKTLLDYMKLLNYKDNGLSCVNESGNGIVTEVNDEKSNYIEFTLNNKSTERIQFEVDYHIHQIKDINFSESYLSIDNKFNFEFIHDVSESKINFNLINLSVYNKDFSLNASGKINNYNLVSSAFEDQINVNISNYKNLTSFMTQDKSVGEKLQNLLSSLSEKTVNENIQFVIKHEPDLGTSFIGKLPASDFMNSLVITESENN